MEADDVNRPSYRILLLDDDVRRGRAIRDLLAAEGHSVTVDRPLDDEVGHGDGEPPQVIVAARSALASAGGLRRWLGAASATPAVIAYDRALEPSARRDLSSLFDLHAVWDLDEGPLRLAEAVDSAGRAARRQREGRAKQEIRELLLVTLCHDLRGCLHVLRGYSEMLIDGEVSRIAPRIEETCRTALSLLGDYLDLARFEWARSALRPEPVRLDDLVADLRGMVSQRPGRRPVTLQAAVPPPGASVEADGEVLRGVLLQMLTHAADLSPSGQVEFDVEVAPDATEFVVTAGGVEPGDVEPATVDPADLLVPFHAWPGGRLGSAPGQGVGLALALRLGELLGGTLGAGRRGSGRPAFTLRVPSPAGEGRAATHELLQNSSRMPILN